MMIHKAASLMQGMAAGGSSHKAMKTDPRSIMAIDVSPFGRSLALLPAMRAIRAAYPKTFITIAASKGICELLAVTGLVDQTIELGAIRSSDGGRGGALKRLFQLARRAHRLEFDLVLDFAPRMESQMLSRVIVRARTVTPSKLHRVVDLLWGNRSAGDKSDYSNVLGQIGIKMSAERYALELPAEENDQFEKLLAKHGSRGGEPIVLLYSAGKEGHAGWPVESFGETAARLAGNFGARIIVADEPGDKTFTAKISGLLPKGAIKIAEPRALALAAAVARASLVITDEPGLAQMAAEFSTPVLEVADSATPSAISKTHRIVCAASKARVTTDEVYEIACDLLQDSRSFSLFDR
jgi:ADP-heptose:LPS heptosyltransferase